MKLHICMECGWWIVAEEYFSCCANCSEWRMVEADDAEEKIGLARADAKANGYEIKPPNGEGD